MAGKSIIDGTAGGEDEVRRWHREGKTYAWMVEEYERKYHLRVSQTMFSNRARARGWDRRITRDMELIPWDVREEHRWHRYVVLLRFEARRRDGQALRERDARELDHFLKELEEAGAVIHYDPDTEEGFFAVPRQPGDTDIIRQPPKSQRSKRTTDR